MKKFILLLAFIFINSTAVNAQIMPNSDSNKREIEEFYQNFEGDKIWNNSENLRIKREDELLQTYPNLITKNSVILIDEIDSKPGNSSYSKEGVVHQIKHCGTNGVCVELFYKPQSEKELRFLDSYFITQKSLKDTATQIPSFNYLKNLRKVTYNLKGREFGGYCNMIGKCGNAFSTSNNNQEYRLLDIQKDNILFFIHNYNSTPKNNNSSGFLLINPNTGSLRLFQHAPNFSADGKFIVSVGLAKFNNFNKNIGSASTEPEIVNNSAPVPSIVILEANEKNEYKQLDQYKTGYENPFNLYDIGIDFVKKNPDCGKSPHFHSWKNNYEVRLSDSAPKTANENYRAILSFDEKTKIWSCKKTEEIFPERHCNLVNFYASQFVKKSDLFAGDLYCK